MSVFQPAYRAIVFASRKVDPSESTPLTPASGSAHSDQFKISTIDLAGYKPYMAAPKGDTDEVTLPDLKVSIGQYTFSILDKRTATSNLIRWVTAFVGDVNGDIRLLGRRVVIEESLDNGSTWSPFFVGRINGFNLDDPLYYSISVRSTIEDLKLDIFRDIPRTSYSNYQTLLPVGMYKQFGGIAPVTPLRGKYYPNPVINGTVYYGLWTDYIGMDATSLGRLDNFVSKDLQKVNNSTIDENGLMQRSTYFGYITTNTGATGRVTINNFVQDSAFKPAGGKKYWEDAVFAIGIQEIEATDSEYISQATWRAATWVDIVIVGSAASSDSESNRAAIWLDNVHPIQVWKDILDGKFNVYFDGTPSKVFNYDASKFNTLIADTTIPNARFKIAKPWKALDFVEQAICKPYSLGYYTQPVLSGSTYVSTIIPFKTTIPTSAPATTITVADIMTTETPAWETGNPLSNMTVTYYTDTLSNFAKQKELATTNDQTFNITTEQDHPLLKLDFADIDAPMNALKIDAIGIRGQRQVQVSASVTTTVQDSSIVAQRQAESLIQPYISRYSNGPAAVRIACRRTTTINSLNVGDWTLIDVDHLPNQATHLRGGNRIMQVVSKTYDGATVHLKLIDGAINATMAVPTINSIGTNITYPNNAADISITTSENARVVLQYALTPYGVSQPSSGDAGWMFGAIDVLNIETKTMYIDRLPSGVDLWVRARCESLVANDIKMPSAWVYSVSHTLIQLSAPTGLSVTNISNKSAKVNWTPASQQAKVEILLASPTGSTLNSLVVLPSGSNHYTLRGLEYSPSITHTVGVRHTDVLFGKSVVVSSSFNATGTPDQLPDLGELIVYYGDVV